MMTPSLFRRLGADRRGVSAVEFALIAPVLVLLYFGLTEFCQAQMAQKRVNHVAATIGDLIAQNGQLTRSDVDSFLDAGDLIMSPYAPEDLQLRVSSVRRNGSKYTLVWSRGSRWGGSLTATPAISDDIVADGKTVIVAEAKYSYDSPTRYVMGDGFEFTHTAYLHPRDGDVVLTD